MSENALRNIEQIESSLWEAADQLRANSKLTSSEYVMLVLGVIFLRHSAASDFDEHVVRIDFGDLEAFEVLSASSVTGRDPRRRGTALALFGDERRGFAPTASFLEVDALGRGELPTRVRTAP